MKKKVAYLGVFTALALIFSYVESLIPLHIGIPGVKLGLANLMIVLALYKMGPTEASVIAIVRIVLSGFLFGNLFSIFYSLSGSICSLAAMILLKRTKLFSVIGVSMAGGVCHNVGQLMIAIILVDSFSVIYYLPVLILSGMLTGILIGVISKETIKRTRKI